MVSVHLTETSSNLKCERLLLHHDWNDHTHLLDDVVNLKNFHCVFNSLGGWDLSLSGHVGVARLRRR